MAMAAMPAGPAAAHPHVWVTVETEVQVGPAKEITGFRHKWTFDEFYTAFAVQGLDTDGDGKYTREELAPLADVNMESLKEFGYFTFAKLKDEVLPMQDPADYWLEYKDALLTLHFTLPLETPVAAGDVPKFSFAVYDPVFYVAFAFADKAPVRLAASALACQPQIEGRSGRVEIPLGGSLGENFDFGANIGQSFAQTVTMSCTS
jgi:ABC-type uncharacterized transport system substrate-binding protein